MDEGALAAIAERYGLRLVVQFGSSVTGFQRVDSDLDLGVLLTRPLTTLGEQAALMADLQALSPDREVDVAILNHADPLFLKKVTERCELRYGSPRRLHELRMYAFRRYQDHRRYLALEQAYVGRAIRRLAR